MLLNVEAQTLAPIGELSAEALGLDGARGAALSAAHVLAVPAWKRTNLGKFNVEALRPASGIAEIDWTPEPGLFVADFETARTEQPAIVGRRLNAAVPVDFNKFTALNAALSRDGVVVHVGRNIEASAPVRVRYRLPAGGLAIFPRTLIVAEANSRVTVIEEFVSDDLQSEGLSAPVAEIFAEDGAEVRFMSVQTLGKGAYQLGAQKAVLGRDARLFWLSGAIGAEVQHVDMDVALEGNGSELESLGFTYARQTQQLLWAPRVHHVGLSTTSQITWKSAVADDAYVVFDGMINIEKGAQGTNSDLRDNVLHLSSKARSDSIPGLEIDANEVKAGHGSTSGQIDEEQLFYLRARGLSREEATRTIVIGFFASIVEAIPVDELRDTVLTLIEEKL
ncbi:MAG TPA: Fe-S cluster assembly protein SufD [Herpetosiphonaceae bacterium]|nr:Fe-S cluster assembly protein SufD [Herpetosiphonaceae bacterium]